MIPLFPHLASHPLLRSLAIGGWALLPIFGTLGTVWAGHCRGTDHEKRGIFWLYVLCQVSPWLLIPVNVPLGLVLWTLCLLFRRQTYGCRP